MSLPGIEIFRQSVTGITRGQIAVGSNQSYIEILNADGTLAQHLSTSNPYITGVAINPSTGDLFATTTTSLTAANTPHHIDVFPDRSGLLVAGVPSIGMLHLIKTDFDGNVLQTWTGLSTDTSWAQQLVRLSIACDSTTVWLTDMLRTIFRYDLNSSTQLTNYEQLAADSPYLYGAVRVLPGESGDNRDVIVAMTRTGDGPQQALCLVGGGFHWVDEVQPSSGTYHIQKRKNGDGTTVGDPVAVKAKPDGTNGPALSLASYFNPCAAATWVRARLIE